MKLAEKFTLTASLLLTVIVCGAFLSSVDKFKLHELVGWSAEVWAIAHIILLVVYGVMVGDRKSSES